METEDSNIKISLNTLYKKEGSIFTWLNSLSNGNVEYIHIDENSYLGKIIKILSTKNIKLKVFNSILEDYKVSYERKRICLSYLLEKNIIFTEDNTLSDSIFNHLSHYKDSTFKTYLYDIDTKLKELRSQIDIKLFLKLVEKLRKVTKIKYPLVIKEQTNITTKEDFNLPKTLFNLFKNMTVLSEDYQFGRAYKQYFANNYGYFNLIPIKEALRINQPEILNKIISEYKQNDDVMINTLNVWSNKWINFLSKYLNKNQIELTTQQILSFSHILEPAIDHIPDIAKYHLLYSKADEKYSFKYILPIMAFLPTNVGNNEVSLAYKANIYPEIGMTVGSNQVKLNQYVEDTSELKIENIYIGLYPDGLHFFNKAGKKINLTWTTLLETKVDGESLFVNNLKQLINYIHGKPVNSLPPCYNLLFHIPRIVYKNICLSPETWNLNKNDDINFIKSIDKEIGIVEEGNIFPIFTKRKNWKKEILSDLNTKNSTTLYEHIKCFEPTYTQHITLIEVGIKRRNNENIFLPENRFNNYLGNDFATYVILLPNLDYNYYIQRLTRLTHTEKKWFFIRYWDNGFPSLRVRVAPSPKFENNLKKWCKYHECSFFKKKFIPEFHRYGSNLLLEQVLHHFYLESKLCCDFLKRYNSTQGRFIVESWFAQTWKKCSNIPLKELYSDFSTKGISINISDFSVPNDIYKSLTSIFNLAAIKMTTHQQIYLYFSLVHMAQNRFYGSSENDEHFSHAMIKKMITRGKL
ncbi:lantibiotic dehydratase [Lactobacillus taiwanensis]|nr:lantibiotic dehydratase [Lactobacillus taiwanensis]MCR1916523.1 lantibiotic dehydratase [Lactobacillus taiwanensis]